MWGKGKGRGEGRGEDVCGREWCEGGRVRVCVGGNGMGGRYMNC